MPSHPFFQVIGSCFVFNRRCILFILNNNIKNTFAKYVELGLYDNILSDNYFDLLPGVEKVVYTDEEIPETFEIKSVYDID